jgi:hypothetical protein
MVLNVHRETALSGLERDTVGDCPAGEHAVALEPEVIVQAAGVVALDDEDGPFWATFGGLSPGLGVSGRLRRLLRRTLATIVTKLVA